MNAAAATGELVPPKRIPVNGRPIRMRWLRSALPAAQQMTARRLLAAR